MCTIRLLVCGEGRDSNPRSPSYEPGEMTASLPRDVGTPHSEVRGTVAFWIIRRRRGTL